MNTEKEKGPWLDFDTVKANANVVEVLSHYGLLERLFQTQKDELVGWCPLGTKKHGKKDSFNFNIKKKTFKCFACKQHGSTIDFVAKYQGLHLRESAEILVMIHDGTAPQAPLPRNDFEELPDSLEEPASEASEQTEGFTQLAETEGDASRSPSADDPATVSTGIKIPDTKPESPFLSFNQALLKVTSGEVHHSQYIVFDKVIFIKFMNEIEAMNANKK